MSATYRSRTDKRVVDEFSGTPPELMCVANGCPNRWSVDAGNGRLCSAHAWAEPHQWPEITQQQQWDETERARSNAAPTPTHSMPPTRQDKVEILTRLRGLFARDDQRPRDWAYALKEREESGRRVTPAQREMWRAALRVQPGKGST